MTDVDVQVGATANDGLWASSAFASTGVEVGYNVFAINAFARWTGITIPDGATIDSAYISSYYNAKVGTGATGCKIYFNDDAAPTAPTSAATANAKVKTTAYIDQNPPTSGTWNNTGSIVSIIQELMASYSYSAGGAMMMLWFGGTSGSSYTDMYDYGSNSSYAMKLHISYTAASSSDTVSLVSLGLCGASPLVGSHPLIRRVA
jgi:hypothetical protein